MGYSVKAIYDEGQNQAIETFHSGIFSAVGDVHDKLVGLPEKIVIEQVEWETWSAMNPRERTSDRT